MVGGGQDGYEGSGFAHAVPLDQDRPEDVDGLLDPGGEIGAAP